MNKSKSGTREPTLPQRDLRLRAIGLLAGCGWMGQVLAQTQPPPPPPNQAYVSAIIAVVVNKACNPNSPVFCDLIGASPRDQVQLAPDKLVTQSFAALSTMNAQFSAASGRLADLRAIHQESGSMGPMSVQSAIAQKSTTPTAAKESETTVSNATTTSEDHGVLLPIGLGVYFRGEGGQGTNDPTVFDPGFRSRHSGMTVGVDYRVSPVTVVGGSMGHAQNSATLDPIAGVDNGHVDTTTTGLTLYGAYYPTATSYVDATAVYADNHYASSRHLEVPFKEDAVGETHGRQYGLSLGGGFSQLLSNISIGPYARLSYTHVQIDAFTEMANQGGMNLTVHEQLVQSLGSQLGAQISYAVSRDWGVLMPNARIEWEHQFKDDRTRTIVANFAADPAANPISLDTTRPDRDYFNLGAGVAAHFGVGRSAFIYAETMLGHHGVSNHAITAELRLEF